MNLDRFQTLADAFGGSITRWPVDVQDAAFAFTAASPDAAAGVSLQPAAGVRFLSGPATSGVRTATLVGLQPTQWYGDLLLVPRVDVRVWSVEQPWSLHAWANRYGAAVGFGHRLAGGG